MANRPNILALASKISLESMTYTGITYKDPEYRILEPIVDDDMCSVMMRMRLEKEFSAAELAKKCKKSVEFVQEQCDKLVNAGVIRVRYRGEEPCYYYPIWVPGIMEGILSNRAQCDKYPDLGKCFEEYTRIRVGMLAPVLGNGVNFMRGIEAGQLIGLIVTIIGVAGVVFYACIGLPHADFSLLGKMGDLGGVKGIFVAIPYAVWFYLAFEAGGMGAEECKNPSKDIPKGFIVGIFTLLIGGMLMLVTTFSLLPKEELLKNDAPIANVINHLFGEGSTMSIVFIVIAMIGLIASLNGIIIGQSRQTYALARCKCLPGFLGKLDKNGTPINALLVTSVIGIVLTLIGSVDVIVVIANMGSAFMALCCFISWIKLAKDQPDMPRPYKCPRWLGYIGIPFCLIVAFCSLYSAVTAGTLFYIAVAFFVIAMIYYAAVCKKKNGTFLVEPEDQ